MRSRLQRSATVLCISLMTFSFTHPLIAASAFTQQSDSRSIPAISTDSTTTPTQTAQNDRRVRSDLQNAITGWKQCLRQSLAGETSMDACRRPFHSYRESAKAIVQNNPSTDWTTLLFDVFRESINETLRDRQFQLGRMQERERVVEALNQKMSELADAARALNNQVAFGDDQARGQRQLNAEVKLTRTMIGRFCRDIGLQRCPAE